MVCTTTSSRTTGSTPSTSAYGTATYTRPLEAHPAAGTPAGEKSYAVSTYEILLDEATAIAFNGGPIPWAQDKT